MRGVTPERLKKVVPLLLGYLWIAIGAGLLARHYSRPPAATSWEWYVAWDLLTWLLVPTFVITWWVHPGGAIMDYPPTRTVSVSRRLWWTGFGLLGMAAMGTVLTLLLHSLAVRHI